MEEQNNINKSLEENSSNSEDQGVVSATEPTISNNQEDNKKLTTNMLTLGGLRFYLHFKFTSLRIAGQTAELSYVRMRQLVTGKYLPSKPELIKKLSEAWDIDPIKLTQLFERMRERK